VIEKFTILRLIAPPIDYIPFTNYCSYYEYLIVSQQINDNLEISIKHLWSDTFLCNRSSCIYTGFKPASNVSRRLNYFIIFILKNIHAFPLISTVQCLMTKTWQQQQQRKTALYDNDFFVLSIIIMIIILLSFSLV
jgi:hypothetical protein